MVICLECGGKMKRITNTHLLNKCKNKLTMQEYAIKYNIDLIELVDRDVIYRTSLTKIKKPKNIKEQIRLKKKNNRVLKQIKYEDLTNEEKQIILGGLLGDSYIFHGKPPGGKYLIMEHGIMQLDYLLWKGIKLTRLNSKFYQYYKYSGTVNRMVSVNQVRTSNFYFIEELRNKFYKNGKKTIPFDLIEELDERGLAVWVMDDGSINSSVFSLFTQSFTLEENKKLVEFFQRKFNITPIILTIGTQKNQYYLRFHICECKKLFKLIKRYMHPKMLYKIGKEKLPKCIIGKQFHFDSAHHLNDYKTENGSYGKCFNEHGGRWVLWIYVKDVINPDTGMVVDYGYLKQIVNTYLIKNLDHFHLNKVDSSLRWRSTTEILCLFFWKVLIEFLPNLYKLELFETPDSKCEFKGPTYEIMKYEKNNELVRLLNKFNMKGVLKEDRLIIKFAELFHKEPTDKPSKVWYTNRKDVNLQI